MKKIKKKFIATSFILTIAMCISIFSGTFVNATEDTSFISPVTYAQSLLMW